MRHESTAFHTCDWCGCRTEMCSADNPHGDGMRVDGQDLCGACCRARRDAIIKVQLQRSGR